jgi:nicotinate-nucleotide pyrophosphorylase (carboxylating)
VEPEALKQLVERALAEDVGDGDITAEAIVPASAEGRAHVIQKEPGIVHGYEIAREAFTQTGATYFDVREPEDSWRDDVPKTLFIVHGASRGLLAAERVALNFMGHLSGIATMTANFVREVAGTGVRILDTRKTTPGLRSLEKEAVAAGGGVNHRMGLYDAVLIKENHVEVAGGIAQAVLAARKAGHEEVEIETRSLGEVSEAVAAGAERILLDNMDPTAMARAVALARGAADGPIDIEASGGVNLQNVRRVAETGVDDISIGALTHSAPSLDLSMQLKAV